MKTLWKKKAQNTAEYAILIALVVGGVVAMQTYAQRAFQGRLRDGSVLYRDASSSEIGNTLQYEPYYTKSQARTSKFSNQYDTYQNKVDVTKTTKEQADYIDEKTYQKDKVDTLTTSTTEQAAGY